MLGILHLAATSCPDIVVLYTLGISHVLQGAPGVSRAMGGILGRCQQAIGGWVGSISTLCHMAHTSAATLLVFLYQGAAGVLQAMSGILRMITSTFSPQCFASGVLSSCVSAHRVPPASLVP